MTAGWRRSPSTPSRIGGSSASWRRGRAAAYAHPTSRSASAATSPRPTCSPGAPSRPLRARSRRIRARSRGACAPLASCLRGRPARSGTSGKSAPFTDSPEAPLVGRAATAAAARPTRAAPPTRGANDGGAAASGEHARRGAPRAGRVRVAGRRTSHRTRSRAPAAAAAISAAVAVPVRLLNAPFARSLRVRTARVLDALLSRRGWIALIGVLLAGIVFFNVDLLQLNRDIARDAERASTLKRENARLRLDFARRSAGPSGSEPLREPAARARVPRRPPGEVRYLKARPTVDARRA